MIMVDISIPPFKEGGTLFHAGTFCLLVVGIWPPRTETSQELAAPSRIALTVVVTVSWHRPQRVLLVLVVMQVQRRIQPSEVLGDVAQS
jgi:hypothetical protein